MEGFSSQLPFFLLLFIVFFLFIILPQQRRAKRERSFLSNLKKGDKVVTKSGIHAKILDIVDKDATVIVETMAGKLKLERSAISSEMSIKLTSSDKKSNSITRKVNS